MIIDCHGHYTTSPPQHEAWRAKQIAALKDGTSPPPRPAITDDEIRESIEGGQLRIQRERGTDLTIFSPRAAGMGHHLATAEANAALVERMQRPRASRVRALSAQLRRRVPVAAGAGRPARKLHCRVAALRAKNLASSAAI